MDEDTSKEVSADPTVSKGRARKSASKSSAKPHVAETVDDGNAPVADAEPPVPADAAAPAVVSPAWEDVASRDEAADPVKIAPTMRKKELIAAVVERSGRKKKDVKPVVEAMLAVLGDALGADRDMNLPPFGKLRIQKVKNLRNARVTLARLRQSLTDEQPETTE